MNEPNYIPNTLQKYTSMHTDLLCPPFANAVGMIISFLGYSKHVAIYRTIALGNDCETFIVMAKVDTIVSHERKIIHFTAYKRDVCSNRPTLNPPIEIGVGLLQGSKGGLSSCSLNFIQCIDVNFRVIYGDPMLQIECYYSQKRDSVISKSSI